MFKGLVFCFSGTLSLLRKDYESLVKKNGGAVSASVTGKTTHLVTTSSDYESETAKVSRAKVLDIWIVEEGFIQDSLKNKSLAKEKDYTFGSGEDEEDEDEEEEEKKTKKPVVQAKEEEKPDPQAKEEEEDESKPVDVPERKNTTIIKKRNRKKKEEDETEEEKAEEKTEEPPQKIKKVLVKGKAAVDEDSGYTGLKFHF
jgi:hypothetical protein